MNSLPIISVSTIVKVPIALVWEYWTKPERIVKWNHASGDWHCPKAVNEVRIGGRFSFTMAAKDGAMSFDFEGVYREVLKESFLSYLMADGRRCDITFEILKSGDTRVTEVFEAERENSLELQEMGWQAILDNFREYVELGG